MTLSATTTRVDRLEAARDLLYEDVIVLTTDLARTVDMLTCLMRCQGATAQTVTTMAETVCGLTEAVARGNAAPPDPRNSLDLMHIALLPVRARVADLEQAVARLEEPAAGELTRLLWRCATSPLQALRSLLRP